MIPQYNLSLYKRAQKRLDGEVVFGNQISVGFPRRISNRKEFEPNGIRADELPSQMPYSVNGTSLQNSANSNWVPHSNWNEVRSNYRGYCNGQVQLTGGKSLNNQENISDPPKLNSSMEQFMWNFPKGNRTNHVKGRPVLAARNEKNSEGEYKIAPHSLPEYYEDCPTSWETNSAGTSVRNGNTGDGCEQLGAILKRSRITLAKPLPNRKSLDSLRPLNKSQNGSGINRKCRTPSPYMLNATSTPSVFSKKLSPYPIENRDSDKFFNPIPTSNQVTTPVELYVTHLDQNIEPNEMKKILMSLFGEHVVVIHVSVFMQSDGNFAANVRVRSLQDAQYAISQLQRRKIGFKRIMISYTHSSQPQNPQFIRWQIVSLLREVPGYKLPLFKFLELFESRYSTAVSTSALHRLRDVCIITDESVGRMVSLNLNHRNTPPPHTVQSQEIEPLCQVHFKGNQCKNKGWAEQEAAALPNVQELLPQFSSNIFTLLSSHHNVLPLASLCDCYEAEIGRLNVSVSGVPLEHLVTCINKVELALSNGIKYLKPARSSSPEDKIEDTSKSVSPSLVNQLNLFGREVVDLLKMQPHCQLMFDRFIPAYHHQFGRQCRVADYGFTKLIELFEALPNVVQVIGEGIKRAVTLSHKVQVRRFTSDLLRVLKVQPSKQMFLGELPQQFEKVLGRSFDPVDYGLCYLDDLVATLESTIVVTQDQGQVLLAIPKRDQTQHEIERTKIFAKEVVELLSHAPQCSILFNKFVPAYHHHYGHQCRLATFGFTKLIELFEAISDVVKLDEDSTGERRVSLTCDQKLKVLGEQISDLVTVRYPPGLPLSSLGATFLWQFGYALRPELYKVSSIEQLVQSINTVKVVKLDWGPTLVPVDQAQIKKISVQIRKMLLDSSEGKLSLSELKASFNKCYHHYLTPHQLNHFFSYMIEVEEESEGVTWVRLNNLHQFAREVYRILLDTPGQVMCLSLLEVEYLKATGESLQPSLFGYANLPSLISAVPHTLTLRGKAPKQTVALNRDFHNMSLKLGLNCGPIGVRNPETLEVEKFNPEGFETKSPFKKWTDSIWNNGLNLQAYGDQVPIVHLPEMTTPPKNIMEWSALISPCKTLLSPSRQPLLEEGCRGSAPPLVVPPDPSELPIPQMYLFPKILPEEDGNCKSFINDFKALIKQEPADGEIKEQDDSKDQDADTPNTANKRKLRLAAHFQTPLELG